MSNKTIEYLSLTEQQNIKSKLLYVIDHSPIREKIFFRHGHAWEALTLFASNLVFFRCGFRAFNLYRYNRGRFITLAIATTFVSHGMMIHYNYIHGSLNEFYRSENKLKYGINSLICHQIGMAICLGFTTGSTYLNARLNGMIPVTADFLRTGGPRLEPLKIALARLKPYTKTIAVTWLISSAFMFYVGQEQYQQSCNLLAKMNRKTLCQKED